MVAFIVKLINIIYRLCTSLTVFKDKLTKLVLSTDIYNTKVTKDKGGNCCSLKSWRSENQTPHYYWLNQSK